MGTLSGDSHEPSHPGMPVRPWLTDSPSLPRVVRVDAWRVFRHTLLLGVSISLLIGLLVGTYYRIESGNNIALMMAENERVLRLSAMTLNQTLTGVMSDLRYLSRHNELDEYLASGSDAAARRLAQEYAAFLQQKRRYDQIRFIGLDGRERIRANHAPGGVRITPPDQLQSNASRYYFQALSRLRPNEIYVSPMDLSVEHDQIERPLKPVVRLGMTVSDPRGERRGYVVINLLAEHVLQRIRSIAGTDRPLWLLDDRGDWLLGPSPEDAWAGQLPERRQRSFARRHPRLWQDMRQQTTGMLAAEGARFQYLRVFPLQETVLAGDGVWLAQPVSADRYSWILVAETSPASLATANARPSRTAFFGGIVLSLLAFVLSAALAYAAARGRALSEALEKAVDNVPMLVSYVDAGQRYRFNNLMYLRTFGISPRDIYGKQVREVVGEQAYQQILPHITEALAGRRVDFELRADYTGAGPRDVAVAYIPDVSPHGQVRGFYAVVNDITLLKETERRERQHMLELAHVSRLASVGEVTTEIAHQVNQPLSAIAMFSSAALRNLEQGGDRQQVLEWLGMINAQVKRASEVVQRLRRFVRKGETQWTTLDLNEPVREVAAMVNYEAHAREVDLTLDLAIPLPPVRADRILMEQVIYNLVHNAMEAVEAREQGRQVTIRTRADARRVWVEVMDNGPGVDEGLGDAIFDPFSTHKEDGLGVGLAIGRSIITAHEGNIGYRNREEGGALFFFHLPREAK